MHLYYHREREGQEPCAHFTPEVPPDDGCKIVNFATFRALEKSPQAPARQGFDPLSSDAGLVYATTPQTTPKPAYLTLVSLKLTEIEAAQEISKPRGRHAKNSICALRATAKVTVRWNDLSAEEKKRRTLDFAFRSESLAWTLNLTPKQASRLRTSDRPARTLADKINRVAKQVLGRAVPISLALEVTSTGRLHAHGIVTLERREGLKFADVLKRAGGKVVGCGAGRQTDIRKLWSVDRWTVYLAKAFEETAEALGTTKIVYQCRATVAGARAEYEATLARQKASRKTQRRPRSAKQALPSLTPSPAPEASQRPAMSQSGICGDQSKLTYCKSMKNNDKNQSRCLTRFYEYAMSSAANTTLLGHTKHMTPIILDPMTYSRLMDALLAVSADAYVSQDADPFKIALGEIAGIWPESVLPDQTEGLAETA